MVEPQDTQEPVRTVTTNLIGWLETSRENAVEGSYKASLEGAFVAEVLDTGKLIVGAQGEDIWGGNRPKQGGLRDGDKHQRKR